MKIIALFNNKGGVGKTTVVYHLAHMFAKLNHRTLAVDLDPQANLTSMFFNDEKVEELWNGDGSGKTVFSCIRNIIEGLGDISEPNPEEIQNDFFNNLFVLGGDLRLSSFEDKLSTEWPRIFQKQIDALRVTTAFYRLIKKGAEKVNADIVLVDVGPNLGAINRVSLLSVDYIIVPLAADLFSLQGLRNLGPTIREWRANWQTIKQCNPDTKVELPEGTLQHLGYIILQHALRSDKPVKSYEKWLLQIPEVYHKSVLGKIDVPESLDTDPYHLAQLRHYRSLLPMAQDARKPVFELKAADGAIGSHIKLVQTANTEFRNVAEKIFERIKNPLKNP